MMLDSATKARLWTQGRMVLCMRGVRPELFPAYRRFFFVALRVRDARTGPAGTALAGYDLSADLRAFALQRLMDKHEKSGLCRKVMSALVGDVGGT